MLLTFHTEIRQKIRKKQWIRIALVSTMISLSLFFAIFSFDISINRQFIVDNIFDVKSLDTVIPHLIFVLIVYMILNRHNDHKFSPKGLREWISNSYLFFVLVSSFLMFFHIFTPYIYQFALLAINLFFLVFAGIITWITAKWNIETLIGHIEAKPTIYKDKRKIIKIYTWIAISQIILLSMTLSIDFLEDNFGIELILSIAALSVGFTGWVMFMNLDGFVTDRSIIFRHYSLVGILVLIIFSISLLILTFFVDVIVRTHPTDWVFIVILFLPAITSLISSIIIMKNKKYVDVKRSENALMIRAISYSMVTIFILIISVEVKFILYGETQNNIYLSLVAAIAIMAVILPFFWLWWEYMSSASWLLLTVLIIVLTMFIMYKWYFYAYYSSSKSLLWGVLAENWYTILTLFVYAIINAYIINIRFRNNKARTIRYHDKVVSNEK